MTIGIVGAGAMGAGIAQVAATAGHTVFLFDTNTAALERAKNNLANVLQRLTEKGKFTADKAEALANRIHYTEQLTDFTAAGLVIEAIVERLDIKKTVFQQLESLVRTDCILASNTSSLSIAALASALQHPERMIGIHFFNPAPLMPLVEIIPAIVTAAPVVTTARALVDSWGKVTVLAKDTPGFIVNRVARPFYAEALKMVEEGVADMASVDEALRQLGFRMGPFELMDLIGHDVNYVVTETVWTQFYYDPRFKPSITQKRLLEAGLLGRKSGRGFYDYREGSEKPTPQLTPELTVIIQQRVLALLINEAVDAVFLRIGTPKEIDLAMTKGVNYPKGLLAWGDEWGATHVLQELERLHTYFGDDRYRPCPLLRDCVANGKTLLSPF
ncbi:MAG: 3-hydroxybutyryl-CoA dehydrogenase [Schleiferiaceae bacterium]|nr:3-hydroxybutyryl-CoA dehydrogenase [Schleiferiaceae bacterium]